MSKTILSASERPSLKALKQLWNDFGNIPINEKEEIDEGFQLWPKGTDRFLIWHWFDDKCPNNLHDDLMFPKMIADTKEVLKAVREDEYYGSN